MNKKPFNPLRLTRVELLEAIATVVRVRLILCLVAVAAFSPAARGQTFSNTIALLQSQVNALPATNNAQQCKKVVLNLALEQATNCLAVGYLMDASNRVTDVQGALNADPNLMSAMASSVGSIGSMTAPLVTNANPYLSLMNAGIAATLASADVSFGKNTTNIETLPGGSRVVAGDMEGYLFQLVNPASANRLNPEILARFLRRAHAYADTVDVHYAEYTPDNTGSIFDPFAIAGFVGGLREFAWLYPGLVLPSQKALWDRAMSKAAAAKWATFSYAAGFYANIDLADACTFVNLGLYLTNQTYLDRAHFLVHTRTNDFLPDGGCSYIWTQNESTGYHSVVTDYLGRYWLITKDGICTNLLQRSQWFGAVSNPRLSEFWTAPSWKQVWNHGEPDTGGEQVIAFSSNPYLRWMQDQYVLPTITDYVSALLPSRWPGLRWQVIFYRDGIYGVPPATNLTVFDANIGGPRSQQGRFAYALNGRGIADTEPGHRTLMGAGMGETNGTLWDAIAMGVYPRVRVNLSTNAPTNDPDNTGWIRDWAWLTAKLTNDVTVGRDFSASSATHRMHRYNSSGKGSEINWRGRQMWLGLPDRVIGWVSVTPDAVSATAYEVDGLIRLGTGGTVASTTKTLQNLGGGTNFAYGDLRITLHNHTFGTIETPVIPFRVAPYPNTEITLRDPASAAFNGTNLLTYTTNTEYHFVVEIASGLAQGAATITRQTNAAGLRLLSASVGNASYLLIYNPTAASLIYSNTIPCAYTNAAYLTGWNTQGRQLTPLAVITGTALLNTAIPALGQILFVNTADASALQLAPPTGTEAYTNLAIKINGPGIWTNLLAGDASGMWGQLLNWSGGVADGIDAVANFSTLSITKNAIVTIDSPRTVGSLIFADTSPGNSWVLTNSTLTLSATASPGVITVDQTWWGKQKATIYSALSGTNGLVKDGDGELALAGNNTHSGGTVLNAGTLGLNSAKALGSGTLTVNGGLLDNTSGTTVTLDNLQKWTWNTNFTFVGSSSLDMGLGGVAFSGAPTITIISNALTVNGITATNGTSTLIKQGAGTLRLPAGSLSRVTRASGSALAVSNGAILVESGATLISGEWDISNDASGRGELRVYGRATNTYYCYLGNIGPGSIVVDGGIAHNTRPLYIGVRSAGSVVVRNNGLMIANELTSFSYPSLGNNLSNRLDITSGGRFFTRNFVSAGTANANKSYLYIDAGTVGALINHSNFIQGLDGVYLQAGGAIFDSATFSITNNQSLLEDPASTGGGLIKIGSGTITMGGTNTYAGNTTVSNGTLAIAVACIATNSTVTVASGAVLRLNFITTNRVGALFLNGVKQSPGVYKNANAPTYITGNGSLLVPTPGPSGPAQLTGSLSGNLISLSWPAGQGWRLEYQTNALASTNWTTWPGSTTTNAAWIPIDRVATSVFYRLVYP